SRPEDLLPLLPTRVSRFRPGAGLPGRDGWQLVELLGTGGFGEVWLAADTHSPFRGAVKFCLGVTDADRAVLRRESELILRVTRDGRVPAPHVVALTGVYFGGDAPWLMYEYVPGGDLVGLVAEWRSLPPADRHRR